MTRVDFPLPLLPHIATFCLAGMLKLSPAMSNNIKSNLKQELLSIIYLETPVPQFLETFENFLNELINQLMFLVWLTRR